MIGAQEVTDIFNGLLQLMRLRQQHQTEVIGLRPVEAAAGHDEDVLCVEQIQSKLPVIHNAEPFVQLGNT